MNFMNYGRSMEVLLQKKLTMSLLKVRMTFLKFEMTIIVYQLTIACITIPIFIMTIPPLGILFLYLTMIFYLGVLLLPVDKNN